MAICGIIPSGQVACVCTKQQNPSRGNGKSSALSEHLPRGRRESRRQVKHFTRVSKNINILEFHGHIWNHHEKYIQMSTNMLGIGSLFREIDVKISEI